MKKGYHSILSRSTLYISTLIAILVQLNGQLHAQTYKLGPQLEPTYITHDEKSYVPIHNEPLPFLSPSVLTSNCENSNFSLGTWKGWNGCYGTFTKQGNKPILNPCEQPGYHVTRHVLKQGPGYHDPRTCGGLMTVYPGEAWCARLGDTANGGHAEQLKYEVTVTDETYLFVYRYAVVLESPDHTTEEQPGFKVEVQNMSGQVIDSTCGLYEVYAPRCAPTDPGCEVPPGWNYCTSSGKQIYWKDWTTVGLNLTGLVGQTVRIVFTTHGCCYNAHCGYAYLSAYCSYLTMQTAMCEGDTSATLTAPPGFGYLWNTVNGDPSVIGDTTASIVVPNPTTGSTYTCTLTAVNGCSVEISQTLTYTVIHSNFTHGSSCATLPIQFIDSSYVNQNSVTGWRWDFDDGSPILTGNPNPVHTFPAPGVYQVQLISSSTEGCKDTIIKAVTVDSLPQLNDTIKKTICSKSSTAMTLGATVTGTLCTWTALSKLGTTTGFSNSVAPSNTINQTLINTGANPDMVIYTITPHKNTCDGPTVNDTVIVNPIPQLTNAVRLKSICDSSNTNITLTTNNDSTQFTWTATASSANLTGFSNSTTPGRIINQVIDNTGTAIDTVYYQIVGHSYGCTGDPYIYKVAVRPSPDLSNSPKSKSICSGSSTAINLTSNVTGTTFTWTATGSSPLVTGFSNNAVPSTTINQNLTNTGTAIETVTYHITPSANSCNGKLTDYVVTVNPIPTLTNSPTSSTLCSGVLSNIALTSGVAGATFTWTCSPSSGNISGYSNVVTPTTTIAQTLTNIGSVMESVTYQITPAANGCNGPLAGYQLKIQPVPLLTNTPLSKDICKNDNTAVTLTSNVATTQFTWTCSSSSVNLSGYSNNAVPTTTISQVINNTGITSETVTYHILPTANSCDGTITDFVVTVNPRPHLTTNPMSQSFCSGNNTNLTLTANCPGTTYVWTATLLSGSVSGFSNGIGDQINQTLTNTGTSIGVVQYTITPTVGPCSGSDTNYLVTVYPIPAASFVPALPSICSSQTTNITISSGVAGATFAWTASASSPTVTGYSAGTGNLISQTLTTPGTQVETVTYSVTPTANGCTGSNYDVTVTINPKPHLINNPMRDSICSEQTTNILLLSSCLNTTFTWTATLNSGNISGFSNGTGATINQILTNNLNTLGSVVYTVHPQAGTCIGNDTNYFAWIKPKPLLTNAPASKNICTGGSTSINLTSNVAGAYFTWTASSSSPQVTGFSNSVTPGTSINQTLVNSGFTNETVTYLVTPHATGCDGPPTAYVVTVRPSPNLSNAPPSKTQCNNQLTGITLTSDVTGTTFTWTASGSSPQVTGFSNSVAPGTSINQMLVNSGNSVETVTYLVTPSANSCDGTATPYVVTVNPSPNLSNTPPSQNQCNNQPTNVTLTSDVAGTTFTWTASGSSPLVTGFSNSIAPGTTINQTLVNSGYAIETVTYWVTPSANSCAGSATPYVVTVYPSPNLSNSPPSKNQCNNTATGISLTSDVTGTTFTWTASSSSPLVTGFSNSVAPGTSINQTLVNSGFTIETVTYLVTPQAHGCNGTATPYVVTVYPTADVYYQPTSMTICTGQNATFDILSHVSGATFTWIATPSSALLSGYSNGVGSTINQTVFSTSTGVETVTYSATPTANGCIGTASNFTLTVNPGPAVTTTPLTQTICSSNNITINLTSNVSGTTFTWVATPSSANLSGFASGSGALINQNPVNSGFTVETVTYAITPTASGCTGGAVNYVVTVNPVPDLSNSPASKTQCNNLATGITLTSNVATTQFTWTASGSSLQVTGFSNNLTPGTSLNQTLVNSGTNIETVTYAITPQAHGCNGTTTPYIVTVNPTPHLTNSPPSQQQCNNLSTNLTLTSGVSGTTFTWTASSSSPQVTGFSNSVAPGTSINQTLLNSGYTDETVTYSITPHANLCDGLSTNYVVTVHPTPDLSNTPSQNQCNNLATGINLTSHVAGTNFTWVASSSSPQVSGFSNSVVAGTSINQTLVNSGFAIETVTYSITPHANGCDGLAVPFVVTVYPTPNLSNTPASKVQCNNQNTGILLTSNVTGTDFTWTASSSSLLVTGYSNSSAPGTSINQTLVNSGTTIETVTYAIMPHANGCNGNSTPYTVTIYPTPTLTTAPLTQTICTTTPISVNLTSPVAGTTYAWSCSASSPNLSGFSNGNSNVISQTLSNSGYTIETVTYSIVLTANGCSSSPYSYVVTVNPKPDLSNSPLTAQLCSGSSPMIALTSHVAGTNFNWTASGSSANITGYGPGTGTLINQVLTNLGLSIESVTYNITPTANQCSGDPVDFVVTIVSTPDVYFTPSAQTICNAQACNIQVLSHVVSSTFTWSATASSPNVSGYANGTGPLIAQTVYNSGNTIETVTYTATPTAFGCPAGIPQSVVLTVNPKPAVNNPVRSSAICSSGTSNIVLQSTVTGSTYGWTASGSSGQITGFAASSGPIIAQTLQNAGWNLETATYVVTPTANSCAGDTSHFRVTVYPVADAYYTPATQSICPLQTTNISISSHVTGASYTWTAAGSSPLVSGYAASSGAIVQQTLNNTGFAIETVTYHVTPIANGCTGTASNLLISVDPNPTVSFTTCWDPVLTTTSKPITLKGVAPVGGTFAGPGVTAGVFYPATAGVGTHTINYTSINSYGCSAGKTQTISVVAPLAFSCGNSLFDPRDNQNYPTVQIGTQCWMASNLNYGNTISGALIQRDNCTVEKFCFNDNAGNCSTMGALYQWDELMQYTTTSAAQGMCPPDWHIPTEAEWTTLFNVYISSGFAGSALKSTGYAGFNADLDGARFKNVDWNFLNFATLFWTSASHGTNKAWAHGMNSYNPSVSLYPAARHNAFSVRCVKD